MSIPYMLYRRRSPSVRCARIGARTAENRPAPTANPAPQEADLTFVLAKGKDLPDFAAHGRAPIDFGMTMVRANSLQELRERVLQGRLNPHRQTPVGNFEKDRCTRLQARLLGDRLWNADGDT